MLWEWWHTEAITSNVIDPPGWRKGMLKSLGIPLKLFSNQVIGPNGGKELTSVLLSGRL